MVDLARRRILIADDEPNIRLMLKTVLSGDGYCVEEASDGNAAFQTLQCEAFDVLVLDLNMPVIDGLTVLEKLKEIPPKHPPRIIILTAYGSISKAVKATRLGALDFLEKPITPDDLRLSVAGVLSEPQPAQPENEFDWVNAGGYESLLDKVRKSLRLVDIPTAEHLLMQAADLAHEDAAYMNLLGVLYETRHQPRLAGKFYQKALKMNKHYEPAQSNLRRLTEIEMRGRTTTPIQLGDEDSDLWFAHLPESQ